MMKKLGKKKILFFTVISVMATMVAITYIVGRLVYKKTCGYVHEGFQQTSLEEVHKNSPETIARFDDYKVEDLMIPSTNGYEIEAKYISAPTASDKTVVMVHGIGMNMWRHFEEALMYLDNNFNVLIYNQRYTGQTGGDNRSFGYHERHDVASIMDYLKIKYPNHTMGAHGFSMGAGTLGMYSGMEDAAQDVEFLILDCPYDKMEGAVRAGINKDGTPIPHEYVIWSGDLYNKLKSGFQYQEVQPIEQVKKSEVPLFVIHGEADSTCTVDMGQAIYNSKVNGYKELWIADGVEHIKVFDTYPEQYETRVMDFIEKAIDSNK